MMESAEEANDDIAAKSFHHTFQTDTSNTTLNPTTSLPVATQPQDGKEVRDMLMARAQEKAHLESSLGQGSQFFDYKTSSVGGIGNNREIRRELSLKSREERQARERRFGHHKKRPSERTSTSRTHDRQRYNSTGSHDENSTQTGTRQEFNSQTPEPRTTFREPPARGYNPFA